MCARCLSVLFSRTLQFHRNVRLLAAYCHDMLSVVCLSVVCNCAYCDKMTKVLKLGLRGFDIKVAWGLDVERGKYGGEIRKSSP